MHPCIVLHICSMTKRSFTYMLFLISSAELPAQPDVRQGAGHEHAALSDTDDPNIEAIASPASVHNSYSQSCTGMWLCTCRPHQESPPCGGRAAASPSFAQTFLSCCAPRRSPCNHRPHHPSAPSGARHFHMLITGSEITWASHVFLKLFAQYLERGTGHRSSRYFRDSINEH